MKPVKKKTRRYDASDSDELFRKPAKKMIAKRDRKPTVYDAYSEEDEGEELDLFRFDEEDDYLGDYEEDE